jgi:hypothetical protein
MREDSRNEHEFHFIAAVEQIWAIARVQSSAALKGKFAFKVNLHKNDEITHSQRARERREESIKRN